MRHVRNGEDWRLVHLKSKLISAILRKFHSGGVGNHPDSGDVTKFSIRYSYELFQRSNLESKKMRVNPQAFIAALRISRLNIREKF